MTAKELFNRYEDWSRPWDGDPGDGAALDARGLETRQLAALILAAPVGTLIGGGYWSPALTVAAKSPRGGVVLTADGQDGDPSNWCLNGQRCKAANEWVYYERWDAQGRRTHGWLCQVCRRLIQSG